MAHTQISTYTHVIMHGDVTATVHPIGNGIVTVSIHPASGPRDPQDPSLTVTTQAQAEALAKAFTEAAHALAK
jgi:hypothetical protein